MTLFFYAYVFLLPLEIYTDRIPKGPTGLNYGTITMLLLIAWWFLGRPMRGKSTVMASPLNLPLVGMLLWNYLGLVQSMLTVPGAESAFNPLNESFKHFLQFYNALLLFFIAANMIDTRRQVTLILWMMCLTAVPVFRSFRSDLSAVATWHYSNDMRVRGPFVWIGSNELGAFFVYGSLFLGLFGLGLKRLWEKGLFGGAAALYCYGVLYSYSRATQLAFLAAIALATFIRYRLALLLIVVAAASSPVWIPVSVKERWQMTTTEDGQLEVSAQSRKDFANLAWSLFISSPLVGHGTGSFKLINPAKMDTHNHFMRTLAESGVIGFALLMAVWGTVLTMSYRVWRGGRQPFDRHFGFSLMIATVGLMIANMFGDRFTHFVMIGHYWILVGLCGRFYADMTGVEAMADSAPEDEAAPGAQPAAAGKPSLSATEPMKILAPLGPGLRKLGNEEGLKIVGPHGPELLEAEPSPPPAGAPAPGIRLVRPPAPKNTHCI